MISIGISFGGWHVIANGGDFGVEGNPNGTIEVFVARGGWHYSFRQDGTLISEKALSNAEASQAHSMASLFNSTKDQYQGVPTNSLLWIFSSPVLSWLVGVGGFIGMAITRKLVQ